MSKFLSGAASQQFDSDVKQTYQGMGGLASTVTTRDNVVGSTYHFRKIGKGLANKKGTSEEVSPMGINHTLIPAVLENWNAPEYTDIFDAATVNFDEKSELAEVLAGSIGRREDQLIIDALDASATYAGTVTKDIGGADTDHNIEKWQRTSRYLNDKGVPNTGRHILMTAAGLESMLGETSVQSSDYNTVKALVNGEMDSFVGLMPHIIEARDEDGLTIAATIRDGYAYHEKAVGLARGIAIQTSVDWIPTRTSWLCNAILKAGSVVRDADGVVKIQTKEA